MRWIVNAGSVLLGSNLAIEVAGGTLEFTYHELDLSDLAALIIDLKSFKANERFT